ncbi:hypothetical protein FSP39_017096 [Pinctada imbricata]|uniref:B box-type domain-containing protein n=1 Tax=Pinctada imbricata TaxID=66713 RepID=A0AA88XJA6_PINIB|nr:hypothetical protein FSP39_017096 [Pinctada imbricata]
MSQPVPSAQLGFVVKCDLCDSVEDVNSFCKNCLQNLCDNCKKLHQKIPSLRSHDIGSIGDGRRIKKSEDLLCSDHGEILTHFCKTCSMNVCPKCLSNHLKHDLSNIDEEGQRMKEELEKTLEIKTKLLEEIRDSRERILQHKKKFDSVEEDVISKIERKFNMILKLKRDMKDVVIGMNAKGRDEIQDQIHTLQNFESKLEDEMRRIKEDLPLHSGPTLIRFAQKESEVLNAFQTPATDNTQLPNALGLLTPTISTFLECTNQLYTVSMKFGISQEKAKKILFDDLNILSSFDLGNEILSILYDKEDKAWITCENVHVQYVDQEGNVEQTDTNDPRPCVFSEEEYWRYSSFKWQGKTD